MLNRRDPLLMGERRMSLSEKVFRLKSRLRDPQWRRYGKLLFAGKLMGIALVIGLMVGVPTAIRELPKMMFGTTVQAQDAKPADSAAPSTGTTTEAAAPAPDPYDA